MGPGMHEALDFRLPGYVGDYISHIAAYQPRNITLGFATASGGTGTSPGSGDGGPLVTPPGSPPGTPPSGGSPPSPATPIAGQAPASSSALPLTPQLSKF